MRRRALIHVAGPAKAGKTALVEALLRGLGEPVICVRAERDVLLQAPRETVRKTHGELRRYADAGASRVAHYRFPVSNADPDAFFITDFMQDYSTAVVIEGDCPLEYVDLAVFVAPPLPSGSSLLVRVQRDHAVKHAASLDAWERSLASPDALARLLRGFGEPLIEAALGSPAILARAHAEMKVTLEKLRAAAPPKPTEHWAIAPGYEGIERAQLIVANARGEDEEQRCAALVEEITRIRKDDAVFDDVLGIRGSKVPVTAVVARLDRRNGPGLKKALARVKRAIRNA